MDLQAEARAHRIGQKREVRVFRLITQTSVEESMLSKASVKKSMDEKVIKAGNFNSGSNQQDRHRKLQELLKNEREEDEQQNEVPSDDQINEMLARSNEEQNLFEELDRERYEKEDKEGKLLEIRKNMKIPSSQLHKINYRLVQTYEVPDWIQFGLDKSDDESEVEGPRKTRKEICYKEDKMDDYSFLESGSDEDVVL